jgi:hypothetical protein
MPPKSRSKRANTSQKRKRRDELESEHEDYNTSAAEDDAESLDSDNLDDEVGTAKRRKRQRIATPQKATRRRKKVKSDEEEEEGELELKQGQEVVGKIVRAPKTGQGEFWMLDRKESKSRCFAVPPGQISQNTFDFLNQLKRPEFNDREWSVFRRCRHSLTFPSSSMS